MGSIITLGTDSRKKIFEGMEEVAKVVGSTMGAFGRNVILDNLMTEPIITNDGITVARHISFSNHYKNCAAFMLKKAADRTNKLCGDGTTSTIMLAYSLVKEGLKYIENGVSPFRLAHSMNEHTKTIVNYLKENSVKVSGVEDIQKIATISSQDPEIGELIAKAHEKVGENGTVICEESKKIGVSLEIKKGLEFDEPIKSKLFYTDMQRQQCELENAYVFVSDKKLLSLIPLRNLFQEIQERAESKDIVFIVDDIDQGALNNLIYNHAQRSMNICVVKAPSYGDYKEAFFNDLCILTGATLISDSTGLDFKNVMVDHLGKAEKVISGGQSTLVVGGKINQEKIDETVAGIKSEIARIGNNNQDRQVLKLEERLGRLAGGIASIKVGYPTDLETSNKRMKIEDAILAVRSAIQEGVIYGSGVALLEGTRELFKETYITEEEKIAYKILSKALTLPIKTIMNNAGENGEYVCEYIRKAYEKGLGYDISSKSFVNLLDKGIVDPVKVVRVSLENAVSLANMILTSDSVITEEEKIDDQDAQVS